MSLDQPTPITPATTAAPEAQPAVDKIAALRALATARLQTPHPLHVILDEDLRDEINQLHDDLDSLRDARKRLLQSGDLAPKAPRSLAEQVTPANSIDLLIASAREAIEAAEQRALASGRVMIVNVHALSTDAVNKAREELDTVENREDYPAALRRFGDRLVTEGYMGTTDVDGNDLNLSLDELRASILTDADIVALRDHAVTINGTGSAVGFTRASSGGRATS